MAAPGENAAQRERRRVGGEEDELLARLGELVVLPTYTAMLGLQRIVAERGLAKRYWERAA